MHECITGMNYILKYIKIGTFNTTSVIGDGGVNVTLAFYSASCCSGVMELVAVDGAGNVGICSRSHNICRYHQDKHLHVYHFYNKQHDYSNRKNNYFLSLH